MSKMSKVGAWHFVAEDGRLGYGCGLEVEPGFIYSCKGAPILCINGMHASRRVYQALSYATGPILCRVRLWGNIAEDGDKLVAQHREVLWMRDVSSELRSWACWCIRETPLQDGRKVWDILIDPRSRSAVEVAERFARGECTKEDWAAAWAAASAAARDAAWAAARAAARDAARAAARAAARDLHDKELERRMEELWKR